MTRLKICGVYEIRNQATGKLYIGGSVNVHARWRLHLHELRSGKHPNGKLMNSFKKHGENAFIFRIIETCEPSDLTNREQYYLDSMRPYENGYNIAMGAARVMIGFRHSEETKRKLSLAKRGQGLGVKRGSMSDVQKNKIRASVLGFRHTEDAKIKIGLASKARGPFSSQHIENMKKAQKGHSVSQQQRDNIRIALTGRKASPETRLKRSISMKLIIAKSRQENGGVVPWLEKARENRINNNII